MGRKGNQRVHQFIDDLVAIGTRELTASAAVPDQAAARDLMTTIAHQVCLQYARTQLYVPAVIELTLTPRDEQIYREYGEDGAGEQGTRKFTAARVQEIAAQRGLTQRHMYNIITLMRRREHAKLQPQLPGLAETTPT